MRNLHITGLVPGRGIQWFSTQMASDAKNVSTSLCHRGIFAIKFSAVIVVAAWGVFWHQDICKHHDYGIRRGAPLKCSGRNIFTLLTNRGFGLLRKPVYSGRRQGHGYWQGMITTTPGEFFFNENLRNLRKREGSSWIPLYMGSYFW